MLAQNYPLAESQPSGWLGRLGKWVRERMTTRGGGEARQSAVAVFSTPSSMWYAGMVIDPTEFSQQLGRLQKSLKGSLENPAEAAPPSKSAALSQSEVK